MKSIFKYFIPILLLCFVGLFTIYSSKYILSSYTIFFKRQLFFVLLGFIIMFLFYKINYIFIDKLSVYFYILCIFMLIYVLLFGDTINGSKAWIKIFGVGLQPSEFMKIALILIFNKYIKTSYGFFKCIILLIIPSILTFLEPDTGTVLFYLIIFFSIFLFMGYNKKIYLSLFALMFISIGIYFYLYFLNSNVFIKIFGTSFFYRTDRIINFLGSSGFQLNNALMGMGSAGIFGNGLKYTVYIPECLTDFMFANIVTFFGLVGGLFVIICFLYLNFLIINDIKIIKKNKYYFIGFFGLFLYQQIQHIMMNIGLLPITGITLPFVSYGGSSIISYFILFGIYFNLKKYQIDT